MKMERREICGNFSLDEFEGPNSDLGSDFNDESAWMWNFTWDFSIFFPGQFQFFFSFRIQNLMLLLCGFGFLVVCCSLWGWWKKRKMRMSLLKICGIPGPEPNLLKGNLEESSALPNVLFDESLISRYSKICGYFLGAKPVILTSCPHFLEWMQKSKKKSCLLDRPRKVPGGISADPKRKLMLGNLPVEQWKVMRKIMNGAFKSSQLKLMIPEIQNKVDIFLQKISEDKKSSEITHDLKSDLGNDLDLYSYFHHLTLDIIGSISFGYNSDLQRNNNNRLKSAVEGEFSKNTGSFWTRVCLCLPEMAPIVRKVREMNHQFWERLGLLNSSELWDLGRHLLRERKKKESNEVTGQGQNENQFTSSNSDSDLLHHLLQSSKTNDFINDDVIVANTVLIFEAAFETTSSCLGFLVHLLVHHPEIQEKIQEEIIVRRGNGSLESYEVLQELKYLEAVILECLRIYPPQTTFIGRSADQDLLYEQPDGAKGSPVTCPMKIPKGVHIQAALCQLHHDPQHWPNPKEFQPDRFLPQNNDNGDDNDEADWRHPSSKSTYQSFGHGPRQCLGKGLALMSLKYIVARLLSEFTLLASPRTESLDQLEITYKTATMTPTNGSFAYLKPVS